MKESMSFKYFDISNILAINHHVLFYPITFQFFPFLSQLKICLYYFHLLRLVKPILSKCQLRSIYFGLVDSIQSCCSPAFVNLPKKLAKQLETTSNRAHKIICPICPNQCIPSPTSCRKHTYNSINDNKKG